MIDYHNNVTKVKIICQAHGVFDQTPGSHLQGRGCPTCGGKIRKTTQQFVAEAKQVHGDLFDYSCADYLTARKPIKIICSVHGLFEQTPRSHLHGKGCSKCANP
jgi:hypothetical protein